jgi:hypothetical protein
VTRHLLPHEIDLLLDDAEGFGVAPLREHTEACGDCRARYQDARAVLDRLDDLPHFLPRHGFADRVMGNVQVFVPWHVAARDTVARLVPSARPARIAALGLLGAGASVFTLAMVWLAAQTDLLVLASGLAGDRLRQQVNGVMGELAVMLFGQETLAIVARSGEVGAATVALLFAGVAGLALLGFRRAAAVAVRRRG